MPPIEGVRQRARREITQAIADEARRQLATDGAPGLSLRAIARELGMVSSAVYRYVASRDELLTMLIVEAYDSVGEAAEAAAKRSASRLPAERLVTVAKAIRRWAVAHPHEYALIYGSPVPGYDAPVDTIAPASRVTLAIVGIVLDAQRDGHLVEPTIAMPPVSPAVRRDALAAAELLGASIGVDLLVRTIAMWTQVFGLISFELFGQTRNVVHAHEELLVATTRTMAVVVGLEG